MMIIPTTCNGKEENVENDENQGKLNETLIINKR